MIWIGGWFLFGVVSAMIASNRGNSSCGGFILGVLLGPFGLLIALFSSRSDEELRRRSGDTKKCPYCAEFVKHDAIVCKHCSSTFPQNEEFNIDRFRQY
jgi:hypothetical protein